MPLALKIVLIVLAVLVVAFIALLIYGNHLRKKSEAQQAQIEAAKQVMSMLIIDKKRMKIKDASLPKIVLEQTPKYLQGAKLPIVKAKVGPRIMTLIADEKIFNDIPVKAEVKAEVSGIYIVGIKSVRGGMPVKEEPKKKGFFARFKKSK
ncbi:MAG: hypothetical protein PUF12_07870 [Thermoflexaceae bacterium]|nr:hypothetical protein [Thermoflexaceae bacterium]